MAKHHPDLVMCRKQPGIAIGRLCEKCEWQGRSVSFHGSRRGVFVVAVMVSASVVPFICSFPIFPPSSGCWNFSHLSHCVRHPLFLCYTTPNTGDGKCVICDSFVNPHTLVHICDECNYGSFEGRCVVCGNPGITDAYYCRECVQQGKDREGCPKIVNLGATKTDLFYERKKYGFKKR